ncbi:hypothetical protein E2C01_084265 [Portunus trituberculatus]|uniref:Uncharacterized protein n=1 Tax=Portunus trituberculatus TaxID=210409 RepID=A0A5B7J3J9_PORTR|nr:hypothetical protein [Portunus trituberculatus]
MNSGVFKSVSPVNNVEILPFCPHKRKNTKTSKVTKMISEIFKSVSPVNNEEILLICL